MDYTIRIHDESAHEDDTMFSLGVSVKGKVWSRVTALEFAEDAVDEFLMDKFGTDTVSGERFIYLGSEVEYDAPQDHYDDSWDSNNDCIVWYWDCDIDR